MYYSTKPAPGAMHRGLEKRRIFGLGFVGVLYVVVGVNASPNLLVKGLYLLAVDPGKEEQRYHQADHFRNGEGPPYQIHIPGKA